MAAASTPTASSILHSINSMNNIHALYSSVNSASSPPFGSYHSQASTSSGHSSSNNTSSNFVGLSPLVSSLQPSVLHRTSSSGYNPTDLQHNAVHSNSYGAVSSYSYDQSSVNSQSSPSMQFQPTQQQHHQQQHPIPLAQYSSNGEIQIQETCNRFLRRLDREIVQVFHDRLWRDSILDYERLKRHLKNVLHFDREEKLSAISGDDDERRSHSSKSVSSKQKPHELFWCVLRAEVDKCNTFVINREDEVGTTLDTLSLNMNVRAQQPDPKHIQQLEHCCRQLDQLSKYIVVSFAALYKLVRAYDYHTGQQSFIEFFSEIAEEPMCGNGRISALSVRLTGMMEVSRQFTEKNVDIKPLPMHCHSCDRTVLIVTSQSCGHQWCIGCLARPPCCGQSCPLCNQRQEVDTDSLKPETVLQRYPQVNSNPNSANTSPNARAIMAPPTVSLRQSSSNSSSLTGSYQAGPLTPTTANALSSMAQSTPLSQPLTSQQAQTLAALINDGVISSNNPNLLQIATKLLQQPPAVVSSPNNAKLQAVATPKTGMAPAVPARALEYREIPAYPSSSNAATSDSETDRGEVIMVNGKPAKKAYSCHQCKSKKAANLLLFCCGKADGKFPRRRCRKKYCSSCLDRYGVTIDEFMKDKSKAVNWRCPACQHICTCAACLRRPPLPAGAAAAAATNPVGSPRSSVGSDVNTPRTPGSTGSTTLSSRPSTTSGVDPGSMNLLTLQHQQALRNGTATNDVLPKLAIATMANAVSDNFATPSSDVQLKRAMSAMQRMHSSTDGSPSKTLKLTRHMSAQQPSVTAPLASRSISQPGHIAVATAADMSSSYAPTYPSPASVTAGSLSAIALHSPIHRAIAISDADAAAHRSGQQISMAIPISSYKAATMMAGQTTSSSLSNRSSPPNPAMLTTSNSSSSEASSPVNLHSPTPQAVRYNSSYGMDNSRNSYYPTSYNSDMPHSHAVPKQRHHSTHEPVEAVVLPVPPMGRSHSVTSANSYNLHQPQHAVPVPQLQQQYSGHNDATVMHSPHSVSITTPMQMTDSHAIQPAALGGFKMSYNNLPALLDSPHHTGHGAPQPLVDSNNLSASKQSLYTGTKWASIDNLLALGGNNAEYYNGQPAHNELDFLSTTPAS